MKQTRLLMGMPVTLEVVDPGVRLDLFDEVFAYFQYVDNKFSMYKDQSEISMLNRRQLALEQASPDMQTVFTLAEQVRLETNGYFNIHRNGLTDPSGLVKGWAIFNAADIRSSCGNKKGAAPASSRKKHPTCVECSTMV